MPVQLHALRECCIPRALRPAIQPACLPARLQALKRKLAARKSFVPWGGGKFVLPHMITVDWDGNVWVTGVCVWRSRA